VITACSSTTPELDSDPAPVQKRATRLLLSLKNSTVWLRM
jgi:hypothetical protein